VKRLFLSAKKLILSIVPKSIKKLIKDRYHVDEVLTFKDLPEDISGPYANEWKIIYRYLLELDSPSEYLEKYNSETNSRINYKERDVNFLTIKELCKTHGNNSHWIHRWRFGG
jgi:hypothetical protein